MLRVSAMTLKDALIRWGALPIAATIVLVLTGCAQQGSHNQEAPALSPAAKTSDAGGWYLFMPPQRAYASDRSPMMGGPLATSGISENRGAYLVYSLTQSDTSIPLSKWPRAPWLFSSEQECADYQSDQLKKINDPAWIAKKTTTSRYRVISAGMARDYIESERCVTSEQLSVH
jgi:hypothetical protein